MVGMILVRNLHRDITRYNRVLTEEEKQVSVRPKSTSEWKQTLVLQGQARRQPKIDI